MKKQREINVACNAFNVSQCKSLSNDNSRRRRHEHTSKLLNEQKRECNDYFFQAYRKIYFEEKKQDVSNNLQVLILY